jgi:hypothetical protein
MSWNMVIRQVASRMNAIQGATHATAEAAYPIPTVDDPSYNLSLIKDACADAEMVIAQTVAQAPNHPWRNMLRQAVFNGVTGMGVQTGENLYTPLDPTCVGIGSVVTHADPHLPFREKPVHEIIRRNRNAGSFYTLPVYYYRIVDNLIYHTSIGTGGGVDVHYYKYDKQTDTLDAITAGGSPLFPDTCIPTYVVGACALLLKEEEYATQAQYYGQLFAGMLQQIAQGFASVDPIQQPAPLKGTEAA